MIGLGISQVGNAAIHYPISTCASAPDQQRPKLTIRSPTDSLLLCVTTVSAIAGVINDHFLKTLGGSLHAQNAILYIFGIVINLAIYCVRYLWLNAGSEPAFFAGYNDFNAILLILLNASIGIVITFVYKCEFIVRFIRVTPAD